MADRERLTARAAARAPVPLGPTRAPVWVLETAQGAGTAAAGQALALAERLGLPFRRLPLQWNILAPVAALAPGGSLLGLADRATSRRLNPPPGALRPLLVLSAGRRSAPVSLWMKASLGCRAVHCAEPGIAAGVGPWLRGRGRAAHDVVVLPEGGLGGAAAEHCLPALGGLHRVGPAALARAAEQWGERLDHLPRPRVALLVGGRPSGTDMEPARAHALARTIARLVGGLGGAVLASTSRRTGREAGDALAAGLGQVMHLLYRWGEPGENPYLGFLAHSDAVVVTANSSAMLVEACATGAPVFVACPELAGGPQRRLLRRLLAAGQVRMLGSDISPWPRIPLDEAGRVAEEVRRRLGLDGL